MSLYPCSSCGLRVAGKLATIYWAWMRADESRYSARQRLCGHCVLTQVWPLAMDAAENLVACPVCHAGTVDDMDPVYATIFIPGQPRIDAELATCAPCAVGVRERSQVGAQPLEDRQATLGGSSPPPISATDVWTALGIIPRRLPNQENVQ